MAFNPSSTIFLCNVPIDSTYQHEIYFATPAQQREYFSSKVVKTFADYLAVRTSRPDGTFKSSVKVNANIDLLRSLPCNYMFYQNAHHGTRYFYAFITQLIYINEGTTEIVFETDVYQTWLFDVTLKPSYVVREHSLRDNIGDNLVPEKFNFQDYVYQDAHFDDTLDKWGYLFGCTENDTPETFWQELFGGSENPVVNLSPKSGINQGLFFYYFGQDDSAKMNDFLNTVMEKAGECVVFAAVVPEFNLSKSAVGVGEEVANHRGFVHLTTLPAEKDIVIKDLAVNRSFEGYAPKNNKLFTAPFYKLVVTNHNGEQAEYNIEDFNHPDEVTFTMYGDVSANPTITLIPKEYKGIVKNYDSGISISGFPQISLNTDTFKLWLAKNQWSMNLDIASGIGQILAGVAAVAAAPATGGASLGIGALMGSQGVINGASGIMSTVNGAYQASKEPNKATTGGGRTNLLTAMKMNKFEYFIQTIRRDNARTIDDFFTMYGYQTNKVKLPNVYSRPYFNYIQTIDINIVGGIPSDDMRQLKAVYNKGVTLWKPHAVVGDYSVDNRPTE